MPTKYRPILPTRWALLYIHSVQFINVEGILSPTFCYLRLKLQVTKFTSIIYTIYEQSYNEKMGTTHKPVTTYTRHIRRRPWPATSLLQRYLLFSFPFIDCGSFGPILLPYIVGPHWIPAHAMSHDI